MLKLILSPKDGLPAVSISFEHSLLSISKWESIHEKAFFGREEKTREESESYIKCMVLNDDPPHNFINRLTKDQLQTIADYINSKQTGTTFGMADSEKRGSSELITAELVYYWMIQFNIPFVPCESWHFNRLMTLIKVASIKQSKPKKMSKQQLAEQYRSLNEQRRKQSGTAG